jgi:hypothetical protein
MKEAGKKHERKEATKIQRGRGMKPRNKSSAVEFQQASSICGGGGDGDGDNDDGDDDSVQFLY